MCIVKNELEELSQIAQFMQEDVFDEDVAKNDYALLNTSRGTQILNLISVINEKLK